MFPGLNLYSMHTDAAQHIITADTGSSVDDLFINPDPSEVEPLRPTGLTFHMHSIQGVEGTESTCGICLLAVLVVHHRRRC